MAGPPPLDRRLPGVFASLATRLRVARRPSPKRSKPARRDELPALFASIGIDRDYSDLDLEGLAVDLQGWGSEHALFEELFRELRPSVVVEVGSWKGASLLHMHGLSRTYGCETLFVCVDTWLGSSEHWLAADDRLSLGLRGGYPTIYRQFVFNVVEHGAVDDVFPMPMSSVSAAVVLRKLNVEADLIYIDAGHEEEEVSSDLRRYVDLLRPGGVMFGAEYHTRWPGVIRAVDAFRRDSRVELDLRDDGWWLFRRRS